MKRTRKQKKLEDRISQGNLSQHGLKKLAVEDHKEPCGYLRSRQYDDRIFHGTCALRGMESCPYPHALPNVIDGKYEALERLCPIYKKLQRESEEANHNEKAPYLF